MTDADKHLNIEQVIRGIAVSLDSVIRDNIGENMGFVLLVFKFGELGLYNIISNAAKEDLIAGLRETVKNLESNLDIPAASAMVQ